MEKANNDNIDINICEVNITDEMLQTLSISEIEKQIGLGRRFVKFHIDRFLSLEESCEILKKLEALALDDGSISIYTSGRNFNELMKAIKLRKSTIHHEMHIDDNDIRDVLDINNIICGLNFSRIACDCYFSDRYLVNFNPSDYINLCRFPECKFDRERMDKIRGVIEEVWGKLVPSYYYANTLSSFEKTEMILDYIKENISDTKNYREVKFDDVNEYSRRKYQVEDYADDAVGVFKEKDGTVLGKTLLAAVLLDNYFAKVNCRVVLGERFPVEENTRWLVTTIGGKNYGHSVAYDIRFSNLENFGYRNGFICLEDNHKYRSAFSRSIDSYSELDEITYFNLKNILAEKRRTFIFPPMIIGSCIFDEESAEDIYRFVSTRGSGKMPKASHSLSVKSAPRKSLDKVHVKQRFPEKFNKRNRQNIRKN